MSSCYLIGEGALLVRCAEILLRRGHRVLGVITSEPAAVRWAAAKGIDRIAASEDQVAFLGREPFDHLFSVVNPAVTPAEVLRLPWRRAVNYHDAPLPRYAGLHATSWAIAAGETTHGVTWHEMAAEVDRGRILAQREVPIAPDDTALALSARCTEAAATSFEELVAGLDADTLAPREQPAEGRSYFPRSARPEAAGVVAWDRPAEEIDALVRALTFGPEPNTLASAKCLAGGGVFVVARLEVTGAASESPPGTVKAAGPGGITVCTGTWDVVIRELAALDGAPAPIGPLVERGHVEVGSALPALGEEGRRVVTGLTSRTAGFEAFWTGRLAASSPCPFPIAGRPSGAPGQTLTRRVALRGEVVTSLRRAAGEPVFAGDVLIALFGAFLSRLVGQGALDVGYRDARLAGELSAHPGLALLFAEVVPLRFDLDAARTLPEVLEAVRGELRAVRARSTYLRDLVGRAPALRARAASGGASFTFPIGVALLPDLSECGLYAGEQLAVSVREDGAEMRWDAAVDALPEGAVLAMIEQLGAFVEAAARAPAGPVADLPLITAQERRLVVEQWNRTGAPPAAGGQCIQHLIEARAARTPEAAALVFRDQAISYRELDRRATDLSRTLRRLGVGPGALVGICAERSIEMVVGLLAALKAGGAYVPLDPRYPRERLAMMLEDARAAVLLTARRLLPSLPAHAAKVVLLDAPEEGGAASGDRQRPVTPDDLAYVIFTSGSTGRPKGVMVRHRNVTSLFAAMDEVLGHTEGAAPGTWLAVTSISFDISVLELLWTLARGFTVVLHEEGGAAHAEPGAPQAGGAAAGAREGRIRKMDFSLFYFAADVGACAEDRYRLLLEGARFADRHGFSAVWTPERHFHAFGGLYPNPSVTGAALAVITERIQIRAGSVVLPLHDPIRVAEEWSVVDNLSRGRVGLSFASGWHANDFVLAPERYADRKAVMLRGIEAVRALWRGEAVKRRGPGGEEIEVKVLPPPVQSAPPVWIAAAGSPDTFRLAGAIGANVLTNMLGQDAAEIGRKIALYRAARCEAGHEGEGTVSLMLHTFVGTDSEVVRRKVKRPFLSYLRTSTDLVKKARWEFPAFSRPARAGAPIEAEELTEEETDALMEHAFERYFRQNGLFGTVADCLSTVERLRDAGVDEIACLLDFGVDAESVLESLVHLDELRRRCAEPPAPAASPPSIAAQIRRHGVTHLQCTPSLARMIVGDPEGKQALRGLRKLLVGGEALPQALADELGALVAGDVLNVYGPTETTVWSTAARVRSGEPVTIGRPIAGTQVYILDRCGQPVPVGAAGELVIGGAGVAKGYLDRPELTAERFAPDRFRPAPGACLYRTGDLARFRPDGAIEILGRTDHQVKLRGHRVEPGEIDAALGRHPGVRESVTVARRDVPGETTLVAYVVPSPEHASPGAEGAAPVAGWEAIWEETYRLPDSQPGACAAFQTVGWRSSFTGEPIPAEEMLDWVERVTERILALRPRRALEIGCGAGLVLFRVAPRCEAYVGLDFSASALARVERHLGERGLSHVTLKRRQADDLSGLPRGSFDVVILNSVVQYFPGADHLVRVLEGAAAALAPGGAIFVGDVRDRALLLELCTRIELARDPSLAGTGELARRVDERLAREGELVLDEAFFAAVAAHLPGMELSRVMRRDGPYDNELTRFRYDVVLRKRSGPGAESRNGTAHRPWSSFAHRPARAPEGRGTRVAELRAYLRGILPEHMVPGAFVLLDALPRTPNGKIDRGALPAPERGRREVGAPLSPPQNELERSITSIWRELLDLPEVGVEDSFFDLGAGSVTMVEAHAALRKVLSTPVSLVDLFRFPTVRALARHLAGKAAEPAHRQGEERGQARRDALARRQHERRAARGGGA